MTRCALILAVLGLVLGVVAGVQALDVIDQARAGGECSWGASSIAYENGHVVRGPTLTGCAP